MVKRLSFRPYGYMVFALIVMIACWESNKVNAAVVDPVIPEQSIRLRILAHSDAPDDQNVKRQIRDEVIRQMSEWVKEPQGIEAARAAVEEHLPEIRELVGRVLEQNGFAYGYQVEMGTVPFPTKMYGNRVYPAGDYEALRITLGKGEGQNWWCVLFPPLCFVDGKAGDAVAKGKQAGEAQTQPLSASADEGAKQEVRFFVWDLLKWIAGILRGLFA